MRITMLVPFVVAGTLAACGGQDFEANGRELPTPDDPGIYLLSMDGDLHRIDGDPEWERRTWGARSDLPPEVEFIVYDSAIAASGPDAVRLSRVAWLRSELTRTGQAGPAEGSEWVVTGLDQFDVPLVTVRHPEEAEIAYLRPSDYGLSPGLYELSIGPDSGRRARIGVQWQSQDKRAYSAANCVDRALWLAARYQPCDARGTVGEQYVQSTPGYVQTERQIASVTPLRIELEQPVRDAGNLTIRGRIVNSTAVPQRVPQLKGTIIGASGRTADVWYFAAPGGATIPPYGETEFVTRRPAVDGATRLDVDFVG